jgi:hypothetical protein
MRSELRLLVPLLFYIAGFKLFPPTAVIVTDEGRYIAQAVAFAHGSRAVAHTDPLSGTVSAESIGSRPIGTSLLQTPFVYAAGWRAAAWVSVIALVATVLMLGRWLRGAGAPPAFALMFLAYAPTLVLGRVAMSDLPSACVVTAALWLFWRSRDAGPGAQLLTGAVMSSSLLFRETNVLLFAPFIVGAALRRDRGWASLVGGSVVGVAVPFAASAWMYGNPFFVRATGPGFSIGVVPANALLYAIALCVLVPAGLIGVYAYRGPRRAELVAAVALTLGLYSCFGYSASSASLMQQMILAPRYLIPLVPLIVLACAESFPRLVGRLRVVVSARMRRGLELAATGGASVLAFSVHPVLSRYTETQASIVRAIYAVTPADAVLVENMFATQKFINPVYGARAVAYRTEYAADAVARMRERTAETYVVFVDRTDTEFYRAEAEENGRYLALLERRCRLSVLHDEWHGAVNRLRIWRVVGC